MKIGEYTLIRSPIGFITINKGEDEILIKYSFGTVRAKKWYELDRVSLPDFPSYEEAMKLLSEFLLKEAL